MDPACKRPAGLIRQLARSIQSRPEQGFRDHAPVNRFPVRPGEQLQHMRGHERSPGLGRGRRRSGRTRWSSAAGHADDCRCSRLNFPETPRPPALMPIAPQRPGQNLPRLTGA